MASRRVKVRTFIVEVDIVLHANAHGIVDRDAAQARIMHRAPSDQTLAGLQVVAEVEMDRIRAEALQPQECELDPDKPGLVGWGNMKMRINAHSTTALHYFHGTQNVRCYLDMIRLSFYAARQVSCKMMPSYAWRTMAPMAIT
jgi:hypothetical protein